MQKPMSSADRIVAAATSLFAERGYDGVSVNDVARRASVSKPAVFHHFNSKEDLYVAVIGAACRCAREQVVPLLSGEGSFDERLRRIMRADVEFMFSEPERAQLVLREITATRDADASQPAPALLRENADAMFAQLRDAQRRGEIRADVDPAAVALLFLAATKFYFLTRNLVRHFPDVDFAGEHDRFVEKMSDLILNGVLPKGREA